MNVIQRACLYIIEPKCVVFIFHVLAFPDSFALFVFQKPVISNSNASRIKIKLAQPVFLLHPRLKIAKVLLHFSNIRLSYHFVSMAMCKAFPIFIILFRVICVVLESIWVKVFFCFCITGWNNIEFIANIVCEVAITYQ